MNNYNALAYKFNRFIFFIIVISPFVAYFTFSYLDKDFLTILQMLTYLGVFSLIIYSNKKNPIKLPKYLLFYLVFVIYIFYSTFFLLDRDFKIKYLFDYRLIGAFNIMLIIENVPISKKHFILIIKVSMVVLVIAFFVIIIQEIYNANFFVRNDLLNKYGTDAGSEDRLSSIYSWIGSNSSGFSFVPIFLIIIELLYKRRTKVLILWISMGIIFALLTKARWIMVNTLLVFFVLIMNNKAKTKQIFKYLFIIPLLMMGTYYVLNNVGIDAKSIVEDRILESNESLNEKSASTRLLAFVIFNKLYWKNAVFGVGDIKYGMGGIDRHNYELEKELRGRSSQIHVGYLMLFYMYGVIGGFLFMTFIILLLRKLYKDSKTTTYWAPFFGILGFAVANLTLVFFSLFEIGLIISLLVNKYYLTEKKQKLIIYV